MPCPVCACKESTVTDSRPVGETILPAHHYRGGGHRRRRECHECGHRWTTHEIATEQLREYVKGLNT